MPAINNVANLLFIFYVLRVNMNTCKCVYLVFGIEYSIISCEPFGKFQQVK